MRNPRQYQPLEVRGQKYPDEWLLLTYSKDRGFFEPVTNMLAEPVIGQVLEWRYSE